jgi:DNA-binding response OmpR family regulator
VAIDRAFAGLKLGLERELEPDFLVVDEVRAEAASRARSGSPDVGGSRAGGRSPAAIIVVANRLSAPTEAVSFLEAGVEDYVSGAVSLDEVAASIRAHLRRRRSSAGRCGHAR